MHSVNGSGRGILAAADRVPVRVIPVIDEMVDIIQCCQIEARVQIGDKPGVSQLTGQIDAVLQLVSEAQTEKGGLSGQDHPGGHG